MRTTLDLHNTACYFAIYQTQKSNAKVSHSVQSGMKDVILARLNLMATPRSNRVIWLSPTNITCPLLPTILKQKHQHPPPQTARCRTLNWKPLQRRCGEKEAFKQGRIAFPGSCLIWLSFRWFLSYVLNLPTLCFPFNAFNLGKRLIILSHTGIYFKVALISCVQTRRVCTWPIPAANHFCTALNWCNKCCKRPNR